MNELDKRYNELSSDAKLDHPYYHYNMVRITKNEKYKILTIKRYMELGFKTDLEEALSEWNMRIEDVK